jgi:hypothetical protein
MPGEPTAIAPAQKVQGNNAVETVAPVARPAPITALAASPTAPLIAVSGRKQVVLIEWPSQKMAKAFAFPEGDVFVLRFSRDGKQLLAGGGTGGLSGKVVAFDVATGRRLFEVGDETDVVLALALSPDGSLMALGGPSRSIKVFRTQDGELVNTLRKHTDWILSLEYSLDGLLLASADRFGSVQVWEAQSGKEFHTLRGHVGAVHSLAWSNDSERLVSGGEDGTLRRWNMHDGSQEKQWIGHVDGILAAISDSAGKMVCGGRNRQIAAIDPSGKLLQQAGLSDEVSELALMHDSAHVVAGDAAGNITVHRLPAGEPLARLQLPIAPPPMITASRPSPRRRSSSPAANTSLADFDASRLRSQVDAAEAEARQAAADLAATRDAVVGAETAVKSAEQALVQLRETAIKLQVLVARREVAARQADQRVTDARKKLESQLVSAADPDSLAKQQRLLSERLAQRRSLHQAANAMFEQIKTAASQAPEDAGLQAAVTLAKDLQQRLAQEVELAAGELRNSRTSLSGGAAVETIETDVR